MATVPWLDVITESDVLASDKFEASFRLGHAIILAENGAS